MNQQHTPQDEKPQVRRYSLEEVEKLLKMCRNNELPVIDASFYWLREQEAAGKIDELLKPTQVNNQKQ